MKRPRSVPVVLLDTLAQAPGGLRRLLRGGDRPVVAGVAGGSLAALAGTGALVAVFLWPSAPPAPAGGPAPPATAAGSTTGHAGGSAQAPSSAPPSPSPSASTRAAPGTSAPSRGATPVPLTARFARGNDGLAGYPATIAVTNPGTVPVTGWTVTLTLPRSTLTVTDVSGATVTRDGAVWTFVPDSGTAQVGGGRSVTVSFRVNGAALLDATPTACTVDGRPCEGVG
ncbi:hypothetical protein GCM10010199_38100 [Dactylosporangium roseum]